MTGTWVLVCDAGGARIFTAKKRREGGFQWDLVQELDNPLGRARTSDLVSDQQGRVRQSGSGTAPFIKAHHDAAEVEEDRFALELTRLLQHAFDTHVFDQLVIAAPPRFLGALRNHLREPVARTVLASLDKDYTHLEGRDLEERLEAAILGRGT